MKQFTIRSISLLLALLMVFFTIPAAQAYSASSWALTEVNAMRDLDLIPDSLTNTDLTAGMSRLNMCRIAVLSYEKLTKQTISVSNAAPFPDCTDIAVAKAYAVGITKGSDDGLFHPNDTLTRAHFIAFVSQFLTAIDYPVSNYDYASLAPFSDASSVPSWIKSQTQLVVGLGIVNGSSGKLNLDSKTSAQEALVMFYRAYIASLKGLNGHFPNASSWALDSLNAMDSMGLIPDTVAYNSMTGTITRLEMCQIIMNTYTQIWGVSDFGPVEKYPFTDTKNMDVVNAYRLDIVGGDGNGKFRPNDPITRQEFFKITYNFLLAMGYSPENTGSVNLNTYRDSNQLSSYAVEPVKVLISLKIVQGDSSKQLNPKSNIVSQEAIAIFYRTYSYLMDASGAPGYDDPRQQAIQQVLDLALSIAADDSIGYVYGGNSPEVGFDCSNFVSYCYNTVVGSNNVVGHKIYPNCDNLWETLLDEVIPKSQLEPGDLVFFTGSNGIGHVGIYIGDNQFVHASNERNGILVSSMTTDYYISHYYGAKRVIY